MHTDPNLQSESLRATVLDKGALNRHPASDR
jgi:hypothetical protein